MKKATLSSVELCKKKIQVGLKTYRDASLFPLFDKSGTIKMVLLVAKQERAIYLINSTEMQLSYSFLGNIKLSNKPLEMISQPEILKQDIHGLWHYDPLWELINTRFRHIFEIEFIRKTNCARHLQKRRKIKFVEFDFKQGVVKHIMVQHESIGHSYTSLTFNDCLNWLGPGLSEDDFKAFPRSHQCDWKLDPIWNQWSKLISG